MSLITAADTHGNAGVENGLLRSAMLLVKTANNYGNAGI